MKHLILKKKFNDISNVKSPRLKHRLFSPDFNETRISSQIFEKQANNKVHENPSSCSMRTDTQTNGRTDVPLRSFENAPNTAVLNRHDLQHAKKTCYLLKVTIRIWNSISSISDNTRLSIYANTSFTHTHTHAHQDSELL